MDRHLWRRTETEINQWGRLGRQKRFIFFSQMGLENTWKIDEVARTGDHSRWQAPADVAAHTKTPVLGPTGRSHTPFWEIVFKDVRNFQREA